MAYSNVKRMQMKNRSGKNKRTNPETGGSIQPETGQKEKKTKIYAYLVLGLVIVIIIVVTGFFYYQAYVKPFQRTIITVDKTTLQMDYFLERTRMSGVDPADMIRRLTNEVLIQKGTEELGISVSSQEIDQDLRRLARGESDSISEATFSEWYRQQLNRTKASDTTYREFIKNSLLATRLQVYLAKNMNTLVPQARVSAIFVKTEEEARKVIERFKIGEDFTSLAAQLSTDVETRKLGGDLGWMPRGVSTFNAAVFTDNGAFKMEVGQISEPIPFVADSTTDSTSPVEPAFFYVIIVTDKSNARQVDEKYIPALKRELLNDWVDLEMTKHQIKWNFNSDIYNWLSLQLAKSNPASNQK
jgi:hypothetical protein